MPHNLTSRQRSERGAIAIISAIATIMLLTVSAIAVDLGNAEARKRSTQAQADLAAWAGAGAGGANLPAAAPTSYCSGGTLNGAPIASQSDPSVAAVVTYLQRNLPQQDGTSSAITPATLTDCNAANGEVFHGKSNNAGGWTASVNDVTVISPRTTVNFGLARVIGANSTTVASTATVEIDTPLYSTLPFYGYTGCDYGSQTIANPTNGQSTDGVLLYGDSSPYNSVTETGLETNPVTTPVLKSTTGW